MSEKKKNPEVKKPVKKAKKKVINIQASPSIYERKFNVASAVEMARKGGEQASNKYKYSSVS